MNEKIGEALKILVLCSPAVAVQAQQAFGRGTVTSEELYALITGGFADSNAIFSAQSKVALNNLLQRRTWQLPVRLTLEEALHIKRKAEELGQTVSQYVRERIL
jgi:hypothetical protein